MKKPFIKKETPQERAQRKAMFIARATAHFDTPRIRREAEEMFDNANPLGKGE